MRRKKGGIVATCLISYTVEVPKINRVQIVFYLHLLRSLPPSYGSYERGTVLSSHEKNKVLNFPSNSLKRCLIQISVLYKS